MELRTKPAGRDACDATLDDKRSGADHGVARLGVRAASGERLELNIKYETGAGNRANPAEVRFYSAKNPTFYQISRQEQVLDILRNAATMPLDRVKEFSFKASGGGYAKWFDGAEKALSWDNIVWINRTVSLP